MCVWCRANRGNGWFARGDELFYGHARGALVGAWHVAALLAVMGECLHAPSTPTPLRALAH